MQRLIKLSFLFSFSSSAQSSLSGLARCWHVIFPLALIFNAEKTNKVRWDYFLLPPGRSGRNERTIVSKMLLFYDCYEVKRVSVCSTDMKIIRKLIMKRNGSIKLLLCRRVSERERKNRRILSHSNNG